MKILIAEDDSTNRKVLRFMLETKGHAVVEAEDGAHALAILRKDTPIDAILSDILMPHLDGYRFCHEVRRETRWQAVPFVFYAATSNWESDEKYARDLGADAFLSKPASAAEILTTLEAVSSPTRRPAIPRPLNDDTQALKEYSGHLIARLEEKNRELARLNRELRRATQEIRAHAAHIERVREEERTHIAREIHDVLAQELTRVKIDLVWIARRLSRPAEEADRASLSARVSDATAQTDTAISSVQRIATELRPVILDSLGLPAAVEWQTEEFSKRSGIAAQATAPKGPCSLERERATALFRILQESLTNIARHAHATSIEVRLCEESHGWRLMVRDNGRGITPAELAEPRSIGLIGMRERAQAFGGTVRFAGAPGVGTEVEVYMPVSLHEFNE